jgi:hypothetical protein
MIYDLEIWLEGSSNYTCEVYANDEGDEGDMEDIIDRWMRGDSFVVRDTNGTMSWLPTARVEQIIAIPRDNDDEDEE